jgi:hypothetical protein
VVLPVDIGRLNGDRHFVGRRGLAHAQYEIRDPRRRIGDFIRRGVSTDGELD